MPPKYHTTRRPKRKFSGNQFTEPSRKNAMSGQQQGHIRKMQERLLNMLKLSLRMACPVQQKKSGMPSMECRFLSRVEGRG